MELWDLIDHNRMPLNRTIERGQLLPEGAYHLVVHICVFNDRYEMLIQKRADSCAAWPSLWDVSCSGCALAKETSVQAAHRETLEELRLDYDFSFEKPYLSVTGKDWISDWYLIECSNELSDFVPLKEEVQELQWASLKEILKMKQNGSFIPYHDGFIELMFGMKKKRGAVSST